MSDQIVDTAVAPAADRTTRPVPILLLALAVFIASLLGAIVVGQVGDVVVMPDDFANMPLQPSPEYMARYQAALSRMTSGNFALRFAIIGGCVGAAIGLAAAIKNRGLAVLGGMLGGGLAGAASGFILGRASAYLTNVTQGESINLVGIPIDPMLQTTAMQCFSWALVGIGIGLGWALADRGGKPAATSMLQAIQGGLLGGILAGIIFSVAAAIFFTVSNAFTFVPEKLSERVVWATIGGVSVGVGLLMAASKRAAALPRTADATGD